MRTRHDKEASSEITGYSMIFGTVIVSISITLLAGVPILQDDTESELADNIERDLAVLRLDAEDILRGKASLRTVPMEVGGGSVVVKSNVSRYTVSVDGSEVSNTTASTVKYSLDGEGILYERGAVFRRASGGVSMLREPSWAVSDEAVVITSPRTFGSLRSTGGPVSLVLESRPGVSVHSVRADEAATVGIEVVSRSSEGWGRYFEELNQTDTVTDVSHTPPTAEIEMEIDTGQSFVYVERPISVMKSD